MDDDKGSSTDLLERPDSTPDSGGDGSSLGDKASNIRHGVGSAADSAEKFIGKASGGGGDGLGSSLAGGLSSMAGHGRTGNSIDGIKPKLPGVAGGDGVDKTPGMFKNLEGGANPANKNDTSDDSGNPSAKDFAKKVGKNASQRIEQFANDAVQTGKEIKHAASAISSLGTDALDDAELAKDLAKAAAHPIKTAKRYGRVALYLLGFMFIQILVVTAIIAILFFGIYKVYLVSKEIVQNPARVATELRVTREMAGFLVDAVTQLSYERDLQNQKGSGVAVAAPTPPNTPEPETNPETAKMYEAWDSAGLATRFIDDYHARFEQIPGTSGTSINDWNLIVNNNNFGPISSSRSQAFIGIFAEDTTHWNDIYTREALQGVASSEFNTESFKLDLPDSERDIAKSRENTTRQLVESTAQPVSDRSESYYNCLIEGSSSCDELGLGSNGSPDNNPTAESRGWLGSLIASIQTFRNQARDKALSSRVGADNLGAYSLGVADQITADTSTYNNRGTLSANIRTGASDTILSSIAKDPQNATTPDPDVLLDLYDRFQTAAENGNFARVNYDRESHQSVAASENYFIAGGQLLNNEMGLLDSWALSENLSVLEESSIFRAAVIGNPIGLFAQSDSERGIRRCQKIFNDFDPVGEISNNTDRDVIDNSCFRRSLIPNPAEFTEDRSINRIYGALEEKNREVDQGGGQYGKILGNALPRLQQYVNNEVRTSPIATESIQLESDMSPEFDGYINQVYGVSGTGVEINGEAYDNMATAAEALWAKALVDDQYGIDAKYLDDNEYSEILRYAKKIDREKMALKPLEQRLFAIKDPGSLTAKLAMMTPTNKADGIKRTLALLKPSNLTSAVASRMVPSTFAESTAIVNPLHAVRTGFSLSDPSNRMSGAELWQQYNCAAGGPAAERSQPEGIPFVIRTNTNPCTRERVLSKTTTCYFDNEDSCSFGANSSSTASSATSSGTVGDIGESSDSVPCAEGSNDLGNVESRYTGTLRKDNPLIIKLCQVPDVGGRGNDTSGNNVEGGIVVNSRVSGAWVALGRAAKTATPAINLTGSSFRLADSCGGGGDGSLCARPGTSMHQLGIAVDFSDMGSSGGSTSSCSGRKGAQGDPRWDWLFSNAQNFGIKQYSYEPWHWDTNPGANRCDSSSPAVY